MTEIKYKDTIIKAEAGKKVTLQTKGKMLTENMVVTAGGGSSGVVVGRFFGKNANFLGDSQTGDAGNYKSVFFFDWLKDILGLSATNNYGYSGTTIMPITGQNKSFVDRYPSMSDDADLIVVWGGTNDYHYGHTLGEVNDTENTTFCGALNNLCKGLISKYPQKSILFVTPTPRGNIASAVATQEEYADAIIKVCAKYCIPVFDAFRKCNMPIIVDSARKYTVDGLHLNDLGHEILGKSMANFILYSEMAGCRAAWGVSEDSGGGDDSGGEEETAPASPVDGKTVTFTEAGSYPSGVSNLTLLVNASDFPAPASGNMIATIKISDATQTINGASGAMQTFQDETGLLNNGAYKTPGVTGYARGVVSGNTITATFERTTDVVTYDYVKIPIAIVPAAYPVSFKVESLTLEAGGAYIPIQAVGGFYANEGYSES